MEDRVRRSLEGGTTVLVGSVSPHGVPSCCRGIAVVSDDNMATLRVYVPIAVSQDTIANIATTRRVAVSVTHPLDHASVQLKGTTRTARLADASEASFVASRLDEMSHVLDSIGIPRHITRTMTYWPAYAIEFDVEEIYEQTPGPNAGSRLR